MSSQNRNPILSSAKSRWFVLVVMLAFSPLSAWCQENPKVEVSIDYSYLRANSSGGGGSFSANGGSAAAAWHLIPWLGLVADFGGYQFSGQPPNVDARMFSYVFGPRFSPHPMHGLHPYVQVLAGGARLTGNLSGQHSTENGFALIAGGGVDVHLHSHIALRIVELDYLMTRLERSNGMTGYQNDARVSTGLVFRF